MASTLQTGKLGELVTFKTGKLDSNAAVQDGDYPFFTCSQETLRTNTYSFDTECVLLAGNNANGIFPLKYFKGKFDAYQRTYIVRPRDTNVLTTKFLYYALRLKLAEFRSLSTGAATKFLTLTILNETEIQAPPLPIQQRIAGILSAYDELIENNQQRIKILESMARSLYREWFVHFRFPGHENHPRVASQLGEVPQGWVYTTFSQAAVFENGDRGKNYPSGSDFVVEGIPFINAGHLAEGAIDLTGMNYILGEKFAQLRSGKIRKGDLLFCLRGSPGRTARTAGLCRGAIASSLVIIRPTERANEAFLYYTLSGEIGKRMVTELNNGAAQPNVSVGSVQKYPILLPPVELLADYAKLVEPIWKHTEILRDQLSNLRKQRDLLLPRLLSGQIEVEAA